MPVKGGKNPNAGRKKGVPNKISREDREAARASGVLPLEVILHQMRKYHAIAEKLAAMKEPDEPKVQAAEALALAAAKEAAPFLHHKLQSTSHKIEPLDLSKCTLEELEFFERLKLKYSGTEPRVH